jgi:hypothetical protein
VLHRAFLVAALIATAAGAQSAPILTFDPPRNFYRSGSTSPEQYSSQEVNAGMQIYPFRPFRGDFVQAIQRTLLREWIDPQFREENVAAQPVLERINIPGADAAIRVHFPENIVGTAREHIRYAILSRGAIAIVDMSGNSEYSVRRVWPALSVTLASLRVSTDNGPDLTSPLSPNEARAAAAVMGVFMGLKQRYVTEMAMVTGSGRYVLAAHYYVFSGDGRVYRRYDLADIPGNDPRRFDFANAGRADPENSGTYRVQGNQLIALMGPQGAERITAALSSPRVLQISGVQYEKQ